MCIDFEVVWMTTKSRGSSKQGGIAHFFLADLETLEEIAARAGDYNGFNLIVADVLAGDMAYLTNRPHDEPIEVKKVRIGAF